MIDEARIHRHGERMYEPTIDDYRELLLRMEKNTDNEEDKALIRRLRADLRRYRQGSPVSAFQLGKSRGGRPRLGPTEIISRTVAACQVDDMVQQAPGPGIVKFALGDVSEKYNNADRSNIGLTPKALCHHRDWMHALTSPPRRSQPVVETANMADPEPTEYALKLRLQKRTSPTRLNSELLIIATMVVYRMHIDAGGACDRMWAN